MHNIIDSTVDALSLSRDVSRTLSQVPQAFEGLFPAANPYQTYAQWLLSLNQPLRFRHGVVVDYVPRIGMYRVQPDSGGPLTFCYRTITSGTSPLGVADACTLMPGDRVLLTQNPRSIYGEIVNVLPGLVTDARLVKADYIVAGSNVGLLADAAHRAGFLMGRSGTNGGLSNYGGRSMMDSLAGEFCQATETGLTLFLDSAMAMLRVDELCGLWMFYCDQLLRLAAFNYQHWTCLSEQESFDDEGELQHYLGMAIYPWEQFGQTKQQQEKISTTNSAQVTQQEKPWLATLEPQQPDIKPFHRIQQYGGYLGQGVKQIISGPPNTPINSYSYQGSSPGLLEIQQLMTGYLLTRTAKGISIVKRPAIPVPQRVKVPADPEGDTPKNYKPSGSFGGGTEHKVADGPKAPEKHPSLSKMATLADLHAYLFNWAGEVGLHYHKKDFRVPEESEGKLHTNQVVPQFAENKDKAYLPPPDPVEIEVDHREKIKVYPNEAGWVITEEGGVIFYDGYGSEISMANGKVRINAALDLEITCGRTLMLWGGRDVVIRGKHSIDLTATENDIRMAAAHNVQVIGAIAGGAYGVLIESRSDEDTYDYEEPGHKTKHSGIVLRTPNAPLVTYAKDLYLRSDNDVIIDANKGTGTIVVNCGKEEVFISDSSSQYFGNEGSIETVNIWQQSLSLIGSALHVDGILTNRGDHIAEGNVLITQGHIFTQNGNKEVAKLQGNDLSQAQDLVRSNSDLITSYSQEGDQLYQSDLQEAWYDDGKAGNDEIKKRASGSLRTLKDYGTEEFAIFEPRWGQMARLDGQEVGEWEEKPVDFNGTDTFCYPGDSNFLQNIFYAIDLTLFDTKTGVSQTRGEKYEDPKLSEPKALSLNQFPTIE